MLPGPISRFSANLSEGKIGKICRGKIFSLVSHTCCFIGFKEKKINIFIVIVCFLYKYASENVNFFSRFSFFSTPFCYFIKELSAGWQHCPAWGRRGWSRASNVMRQVLCLVTACCLPTHLIATSSKKYSVAHAYSCTHACTDAL